MPDIEQARAELNRIEAFLRTRYHYPHPIFGHVAAALEYLGEPPPAAVLSPVEVAIRMTEAEAPAEASAEAEAEAPVEVEAEAPAVEPPAEPKAPAQRGRKRG